MSTMSSSTLVMCIQALVMCIQAVEAEIGRLRQSVAGELGELPPDEQEMLLAYAKAASELAGLHASARAAEPGLPPYDELVPAS